MADITSLDYILLPFYLWLIYKIAFYYRDKFYPENHPLRLYFIPGLTAKIAGAIFIGLIYCYYYNGGDTFGFFYHSKVINSTLGTAPGTWFRLITHHADENNLADARALSDMYWYDDIPSYTTACLGAFIGLFCFTKYLLINVILASIVFVGTWLMFITFTQQYNYTKGIAIAILFMPGPIVWGSGLFKDSFCMFSIGCLIYCFYILFEKREFRFWLLFLSILSITLILLIKAYIIIALFPVLIFKIILEYKKRAKANPQKKVVFYFILSLTVLLGFFIMRRAVNYLSSFSAENVLTTIKHQKDYILSVTDPAEGSSYNLGDFDPSIQGVVKLILPAINVTLFRPYPWEAKGIVPFLNSLESSAILLLTLYLILTRNIFRTIIDIYRDPNLIMCLVFTLIFAFFVGISSYNFGALSRYKIPCTPFYVLFLMILISKKNDKASIEVE